MLEMNRKMAEPALRSSEVVMDSLHQFANDRFAFYRACLDVHQQQIAALHSADGASDFANTANGTDYYKAVEAFGEAMRQNTQQTFERLMAIGR
jgi:hypothetical protein